MEIPQGWWVDMDQMPTLLNVHQLVLEGLTAFVISVAAMLMFRKIAPLIQLVDLPSGHTATTGHETKKITRHSRRRSAIDRRFGDLRRGPCVFSGL